MRRNRRMLDRRKAARIIGGRSLVNLFWGGYMAVCRVSQDRAILVHDFASVRAGSLKGVAANAFYVARGFCIETFAGAPLFYTGCFVVLLIDALFLR